MQNPNYHGFGDEQINMANTMLGRDKFNQYEAAKVKTLRGDQIPVPQNEQIHPLKGDKEGRWSNETR